MTRANDRIARALLTAGAAVGILAGAVAARIDVSGRAAQLPPDAIALVNDRPILRDELARAVEMLLADRREPPAERDRAAALGRLVDEELLAQHAIASGLLARDRTVRDVVLRAMVDSAVADAAGRAPTDGELGALLEMRRATAGAPAPPDLETARPELERAFTERARGEAMQAYLEGLRARARIVFAPGAAP